MNAINGIHHLLCQFDSAITALEECFVHSKANTQPLAVLADDINLLFGIRIETVQSHDDRLSEALHIVDMAVQVLQTLFQSIGVWLLDLVERHTAMHLQPLGGGNDDHQTRLQPGLTALDIKELFGAQVSTEARLRHHIVTIGHRHLCGHHAGTAMRDIRERTSMDKGRRLFCGLH